MINKRLAVTILLSLLAGCGKPSGNTAAMPSTPALQSLYLQSCYSCHHRGANGAPRSGHAGDWQPRLEKGMDTLVQHTINGFGAMPPRGMCIGCTAEDLRALIEFMSNPAQD